MVETAIILYTVRDLDAGPVELIERAADVGYDGVQLAGLGDATPEAIRDALDANGLGAPAPHVGLEPLEDDFASFVEPYVELGVDGVVVSYIPESGYESREAVETTADRLSSAAARLADHRLDLHYHNHAHEFTELDDGTVAFDLLCELTDVGIELDVGWALTAGHDPAALIDRYDSRMRLLHMKDMADGEFTEIGDGDVDMAACAAAGRRAGTEWFIYEHDEPADPDASFDHGAAFLDGL